MHSCNVQMDHSGLEVRESLPKSGVVNLRAVVFSVGQQRCSRCCISCQIQRAWERQKSMLCPCWSFERAEPGSTDFGLGEIVQTLSEQGRPFEALLFGQKCVPFFNPLNLFKAVAF